MQKTKSSLYFDFNASSMPDKRVLSIMMKHLKYLQGHNSSANNQFGTMAQKVLEDSRSKVARILNCKPQEIIFTSGATESNNIIIIGKQLYITSMQQQLPTFLFTDIDHDSIMQPILFLKNKGLINAQVMSSEIDGELSIHEVSQQLLKNKNIKLIAFSHVNSEVGTINKIENICNLIKLFDPLIHIHIDCAQSCGKLSIDLEKIKADSIAFSAHKFYGVQGIGGLFLRISPKIKVLPCFFGGSQERGFKPGTTPTVLAASLAHALEICQSEMIEDTRHCKAIQQEIIENVSRYAYPIILNGAQDLENRIYSNINFSVPGVEGEGLTYYMFNYSFSTGSACSSNSLSGSRVLKSLKCDPDFVQSSIRISIGRQTKMKDAQKLIKKLIFSIKKLRKFSPMF